MHARILASAVAALFVLPVAAFAGVPDYVAAAVSDPSRPAREVKLDSVRKPADVIAFAGVRPGQTVGEDLPGGGYYTRLLSDVVGPSGHVYMLETTVWGDAPNDQATMKELKNANASLDVSPFGQFQLAQQVDYFWITDNYHDLHVAKYGNVDMAAFNRHVFEVLKPGGIYFILDHAATPGTGATLSPKLHRIDKAIVISEVTAAGFKLVGESDILANPADDHTKPVFDPAMRWRTDQFILKFQKPG